MLKFFFCLLALGNVVLFGLNKGYWGPKAHEIHEPWRLGAQLHADKLQLLSTSIDLERAVPVEPIVVPTRATPAAVAAPATNDVVAASPPAPSPAARAVAPPATREEPDLVCLEFAYFNAADAKRFDAALAGLPLATKPMQRSVEEIVSYMVYVPNQDGKPGADRKASELRRQGINDFYVMPGTYAIAALRWNISLGVFKTEPAAKAFVARLSGQGVKGLRIVPRKSGATRQLYQLRDVDQATQARLTTVMRGFNGQKMYQCE